MLLNILIGSGLVIVTTFIHAAAMVFGLHRVESARKRHKSTGSRPRRATAVAALVVVMFLASVLESTVWAVTYVMLGAIEGFERAIYFSTVTYTTLGYGDVVMEDRWRLLSAFEAADGIIMFGWTTALIFAAVNIFYRNDPEIVSADP